MDGALTPIRVPCSKDLLEIGGHAGQERALEALRHLTRRRDQERGAAANDLLVVRGQIAGCIQFAQSLLPQLSRSLEILTLDRTDRAPGQPHSVKEPRIWIRRIGCQRRVNGLHQRLEALRRAIERSEQVRLRKIRQLLRGGDRAGQGDQRHHGYHGCKGLHQCFSLQG